MNITDRNTHLGDTNLTQGPDQRRQEGSWQNELPEHSDVYQDLFDHVPCFITVQDKNYRLLRYNREFHDAFDPTPGAFCYQAYKGRDEKCRICPVEKTFEDGQPRWSEESGLNKYGETLHWVVKTSPIKNAKGGIVAVMEMCLDITHKKRLEEKLEISERRYRAIFNNIPNPVFVLDGESLEILDCNGSVSAAYGYTRNEIIHNNFLMFFKNEERENYSVLLKNSNVINQAKHLTRDSREIFVNIRISPSEHLEKKSFLVTTSDITQRVEMEQQLIQSSKMATLGEMATGVAHELNQPLTVINSASNYFIKKINNRERIQNETLFKLSNKIAGNVDRATKIINHMREFGRKSDMNLEKVQMNDILKRAYEVLSQQLKLRGIMVQWNLQDRLPVVEADAIRLEQVIINLLLNARDAIEEKIETQNNKIEKNEIILKTSFHEGKVKVEVCDTGSGISDPIKNRIFEPFFTTKKVGKGTGLGLSISYGIIKECGGSIRAMSQKNEGTCFVLELPASP